MCQFMRLKRRRESSCVQNAIHAKGTLFWVFLSSYAQSQLEFQLRYFGDVKVSMFMNTNDKSSPYT